MRSVTLVYAIKYVGNMDEAFVSIVMSLGSSFASLVHTGRSSIRGKLPLHFTSLRRTTRREVAVWGSESRISTVSMRRRLAKALCSPPLRLHCMVK